MFGKAANMGDTKSTITHPASTTHGRLTDDQRAAVGINEGLIRLAVKLEDAEDLDRVWGDIMRSEVGGFFI